MYFQERIKEDIGQVHVSSEEIVRRDSTSSDIDSQQSFRAFRTWQYQIGVRNS